MLKRIVIFFFLANSSIGIILVIMLSSFIPSNDQSLLFLDLGRPRRELRAQNGGVEAEVTPKITYIICFMCYNVLGNTLLFHSVANVQVAGEFKVGDFFYFFLIGFQQLCK